MKNGLITILVIVLGASLFLYESWDYASVHRLQEQIRVASAANQLLALRASQISSARGRTAAAFRAEEKRVGGLLAEMASREQRVTRKGDSDAMDDSTASRNYAKAANVGQGSPLNALQTAIWATYHGNVQGLAKMIVLDPSAKGAASTVFSQLPSESQASLQDADQMVALLIEYAYPSSGTYEVSWSGPVAASTDEWLVGTKMVSESGQATLGQLTFRKVDGNWMLVVPQNVVQQLGGMLSGGMSQPEPAASAQSNPG
jgi:hypothetical protein